LHGVLTYAPNNIRSNLPLLLKPSRNRLGGSLLANAFARLLCSSCRILVPETKSIVGALQLKTFVSKLPILNPALDPKYKGRSLLNSDEPGIKNESCDKVFRSRISPSLGNRGG